MRLTRGLLLATALGVGVGVALARGAAAQELKLDAVPEGPRIPADNAASDLAARLEAEHAELAALAERSAGEGRSAAAAKARLRTIAAYLLRSGAGRPWAESAPAVFGARISLLIGRTDALIDLAAKGRGARDRPLSQSDAGRAVRLLDALGSASIDPLRRASIAKPDALARETADALRVALAALDELTVLLEPAQELNPWPVVAAPTGAQSAAPQANDRAGAAPSVDALLVATEALPEGEARAAIRESMPAAGGAGAIPPDDRQRLMNAVEAAQWLESVRNGAPPLRIPGAAVESALAGVAALVRAAAADGAGASLARASLDALRPRVAAGRAMLDLECLKNLSESERANLADAVASLFASAGGDIETERARARVAERITDACGRANRLDDPLAGTAPRDLKDALRQLDREVKSAIRALPEAVKLAAADPNAASDPSRLSGFERLRTLEQDRARILSLQAIIDSISSVQPSSGRAFAGVARRLARMLLDPLRRSDAQLAFVTLEAQYGSAFPLPYEDSLRRRTPRALELADRAPELLLERAGRVRSAWCEAIGRGDFGGEAALRLSEAARLCQALADLDQVIVPIDRAASDRLCMWGGWATRRALAAPATQDLTARANLAVRSFVAVRSTETQAAFARDLDALERAIPIVRFTAAVERAVGPELRGDADSVRGMLAPIIAAPAAGAFLAEEWDRLLMLHRAMIESERARRTANGAQQRALDAYMAELARDLESRAFGPPRVISRVPGFDGSVRDDEESGKRPKPGGKAK